MVSLICKRTTRHTQRAFTLVEVLVVVTVLGIAGAMVIPAMGQVGGLRIQAAVRTVVADITFAQSDAVAFQERRAVVFNLENSTYAIAEVPGSEIDLNVDTMFHPSKPGGRYVVDFNDEAFGGAVITSASFAGEAALIFDAMGGPIDTPESSTPGAGGRIRISGNADAFDVNVQPFTGRVTVSRVDLDAEGEAESESETSESTGGTSETSGGSGEGGPLGSVVGGLM